MKAKFRGFCRSCQVEWRPGTDIALQGGRWMHEGCAAYEKNVAAVSSGPAFRPRRRLKSRPGGDSRLS